MTTINENGVLYDVDVENGQKTGFFLDQKYNRLAVAKIAAGRHVLDCFTHTGAFALNAAKGGAASVTAVDVSEEAVAMTNENIRRNGLEQIVTAKQANVFDLLTEMAEQKCRDYDFIILDPPAFTKSGHTVHNAIRGYKEINLKAMKLLPRGGYLATCSCPTSCATTCSAACSATRRRMPASICGRLKAASSRRTIRFCGTCRRRIILKFYLFQVV